MRREGVMCEGTVGEGVVRVRGEKVRDNTLHMQVMQQMVDELRGGRVTISPPSPFFLSLFLSLSLSLSLSFPLPFPPHPLPLPGMLLG